MAVKIGYCRGRFDGYLGNVDQDTRARRDQHAGPGQAAGGQDPPGLDHSEVYGDPTVHPQTVYGDGSQTRSFCYVDDLVAGLIKFMEAPSEMTGPINLGNAAEFAVRELDQSIAAPGAAR